MAPTRARLADRALRAVLAALAIGLAAAPAGASQVSDLAVFHRDGQTFLTWRAPQLGDSWTYRVYSSPSPIAGNSDLADTTLVAVVNDSSWYDRRLSVRAGQRYGYVVDPLQGPLDATQALCVVTPVTPGDRYYFVSSGIGGEPEDLRVSPGGNATVAAVSETVGLPRPVYQRTLTRGAIGTQAEIYTLWVTDRPTSRFPAMANRPGMAFDCAVVRGGAAPDNPLIITMHQRQGDFLQLVSGSYRNGEWVLALDDPLPNEENTFWYGYHENYDVRSATNPVPGSGLVHDYTFQRVQHTLLWARRSFPVDTARVYAMGASMGGIGSFSLAFRRPDLVAAIYTDVPKFDFSFLNDPNPLNAFNAGAGLRDVVNRMWGTVAANLASSDGMRVFEALDDGHLAGVRQGGGVPPVVAFSGKNDYIVGWAEKIGFYAAMQANRLGGSFFWDMREHVGTNAAWGPAQNPLDAYRFRTDRSFPALSRCAADFDPGNGSAASGDSIGCINAFVEWDTSLVDQPAQWQTTLTLRDLPTSRGPVIAPESTTVDVTPRRLQRFVVSPGATYRYTVTRVSDAAVVRSGSVVADGLGLVTVPAVPVPRLGCRLRIEPGPAPGGALRRAAAGSRERAQRGQASSPGGAP